MNALDGLYKLVKSPNYNDFQKDDPILFQECQKKIILKTYQVSQEAWKRIGYFVSQLCPRAFEDFYKTRELDDEENERFDPKLSSKINDISNLSKRVSFIIENNPELLWGFLKLTDENLGENSFRAVQESNHAASTEYTRLIQDDKIKSTSIHLIFTSSAKAVGNKWVISQEALNLVRIIPDKMIRNLDLKCISDTYIQLQKHKEAQEVVLLMDVGDAKNISLDALFKIYYALFNLSKDMGCLSAAEIINENISSSIIREGNLFLLCVKYIDLGKLSLAQKKALMIDNSTRRSQLMTSIFTIHLRNNNLKGAEEAFTFIKDDNMLAGAAKDLTLKYLSLNRPNDAKRVLIMNHPSIRRCKRYVKIFTRVIPIAVVAFSIFYGIYRLFLMKNLSEQR